MGEKEIEDIYEEIDSLEEDRILEEVGLGEEEEEEEELLEKSSSVESFVVLMNDAFEIISLPADMMQV